MAYAYGLSSGLVALVHILIGLALAYYGWQLNQGVSVGQEVAVGMIVLGSLATAYHAHLYYLRYTQMA